MGGCRASRRARAHSTRVCASDRFGIGLGIERISELTEQAPLPRAKVRDVAEHEGREPTSGTLAFIEDHIGRVIQPTLPLW
jgi:hypothetical protein